MAIQKELWQNTIIEGLFADNSFMSKAVNDDMYVNQGKKYTSRMRVHQVK